MGVSARSVLVSTIVIALALFLVAPGQAAGGPVVRDRSPQAGAPPSPALAQHAERFFQVPAQVGPPSISSDRQDAGPTAPGEITLYPPDEAEDERTVQLTPDEYAQFQQLVKIGRASALQVGAVTAMSVGTVVLIVGLAYTLLMVVFRHVFNRWFDADVYNQTWPSVCVICTMILGAVIVLAAAVMR